MLEFREFVDNNIVNKRLDFRTFKNSFMIPIPAIKKNRNGTTGVVSAITHSFHEV